MSNTMILRLIFFFVFVHFSYLAIEYSVVGHLALGFSDDFDFSLDPQTAVPFVSFYTKRAGSQDLWITDDVPQVFAHCVD